MPVKVLMVCLGNICRSPLAEGILASKVHTSEIFVDSAGTAGYHIGKAPDERSIHTAALKGIDISRQKCRRFTIEDFDVFDYIFAMDRENLMNLQDLARNEVDLGKVHLLLEMAGLPGQEVPDPYYGGLSDFQEVFRLIDLATDKLLPILSAP
jgi:protein-tyrosine phosphatase